MPRATPLTEGGFSTAEVLKTIRRYGKRVSFPVASVREGMQVEREHADVTKDSVDILKITLAHLKETPDYYKKLRRMEGKMSGRLRYATPAGPVTAPTDRAGVRAKMTVKNGDALYAKKSLVCRPSVLITLRQLKKGFNAPDVTESGSSPRWETPPIPDYQDIYFQPEDDERKKKERKEQEIRRRSLARRNKGVFGFHGLAYRGKAELRYDPDETLASADTQTPKRPGNRRPTLIAPKVLPRFEAGQTRLPKLVVKRGK